MQGPVDEPIPDESVVIHARRQCQRFVDRRRAGLEGRYPGAGDAGPREHSAGAVWAPPGGQPTGQEADEFGTRCVEAAEETAASTSATASR